MIGSFMKGRSKEMAMAIQNIKRKGKREDLIVAVNDYTQSGLVLAEGTPNTFLDPYHPGKYYPAADAIVINPGHTLDAAKITVWATGYLIEPDYTLVPV